MSDVDVDLAPPLAASLEGRIVSRYDLPSAADLNSIHAQLARVAREQKRFALVEVKSDGQ